LNHHYTAVKVKGENGAGSLENIIAISAGNHHVLALDNQGCVWAWGKNEFGQLGIGESEAGPGKKKETPVKVKKVQSTDLTGIIYIDAGFEHSLAIDKDGQIWVWGCNTSGELGLGHKQNRYNATPISE
jgi:alpha-tubulin suppressor-like RCC1 family protein